MSAQEQVAKRRRKQLALLCAAIAVVIVAAWLLWPQPKPPTVAAANPTVNPSVVATTPKPNFCQRSAAKPFTPTRISITKVPGRIQVVALGRDAQEVPSTPPISNTGKAEFAWDKPPGLKPGSTKGNVLLNAHTWPDGTALGNKLLAKLKVDDQIVVRGHNAHLCYRVTKRIEVVAADGYTPYYDRRGNPQLAIIVCSGTRLGPGNWTKRTIWFAAPATD